MFESLIELLGRIAEIDAEIIEALEASEDEARPFASLTEEQLDAVHAALVAAAAGDEVATEDLLAAADVIDALTMERGARVEVAEAEAAERAAALERIQSSVEDDTEDGDDGEDGDDDAAVEDATDADDDEGADDDAEAKVPVGAAAAATGRRVPLARTNARARKATKPAEAPATEHQLTATMLVDTADTARGERVTGIEALSVALADAINQRRPGKAGRWSEARLARLTVEYPDDRKIDAGNASQKIQAAISQAKRDTAALVGMQKIQALRASGGLCAPRTPYYGQATAGDAMRPVKDAMIGFNADRGGITFNPPTTLAGGSFSTGVSEWTAANDATPSDPATKPCLSLTCEAPDTVDVAAITQCLEVGNFRAMTFPEQVEAWLHWLNIAHTRVAESALITVIDTAAGATIAVPQRLGITRDFLYYLELFASQYRDNFRMAQTEVLEVYVPERMRNAMIADLVQEMPGSTDERLATAPALVDRFIREHNVAPIWFRDQQNAPELTAGVFNQWPDTWEWYITHPGAYLFLDAGVLNLGIGGGEPVRDSGLVETNDFRLFAETFEAGAHIGLKTISVTQTVCVNGATAGNIDPDTICGVS